MAILPESGNAPYAEDWKNRSLRQRHRNRWQQPWSGQESRIIRDAAAVHAATAAASCWKETYSFRLKAMAEDTPTASSAMCMHVQPGRCPM